MSQISDQPDAKASVAYLARVLGVESVLLPETDFVAPAQQPSEAIVRPVAETIVEPIIEATIEAGPADAPLVFLVPYQHMNGETRDLWTKMVQAMKQDPGEVWLFGLGVTDADIWERLAGHPRKAIVVLGENAATRLFGEQEWIAARWLEPRPGLHVLVSHGLDAMLTNPDLKRSAWQHLQMAMKRLS